MPPFRAEHIGSLLRPKALLDARYASPPLDAGSLRALEDEHVARVIRWQESIGLQSVTDGEFRRESWRLGFVSKVAGFARADAVGDVDVQRDDAGNAAKIGSAPLAVAKVRRTGPIVADEVAFARRHATRTVKATLPAPSYLHYPRGDACVDPAVYPDIAAFFDDVVEVYVAELEALAAAGGRYVQIDEVAQTVLCDETIRDAVRTRGDDPDRLVALYIDLINRIARRRPAGMTIGVHMCRGNAMGKWMASGGYERIAEQAFGSLEVDAFFLEYDTARAGGFEPLRSVPGGKSVVLGLVSTKTPQLESPDDLKRRIDEASRYVPLERLAISPQCGFASRDLGTALTFADQEAKLRLVVETATAVWGA
ncbi:MAG: 5-methyltetrahydropteroyltriglutamate--homocysteine S-methyltransferase [Burkholderiales bacterium]